VGIQDCKLVQLPVKEDPQGDLAFAEGERHIPFSIARVFYVYDLPREAQRGGHAHVSLEEVIFCVSGSFELVVDDGVEQRPFLLDDPRVGLYLPPMVWQDMSHFSPGTVYLVLSSEVFDEGDYIRDHEEFVLAAQGAAAGA
jgi:dTDP-4-dehydrorhamnose 3,5-epimerase-like enzyme